VRVLKHMHPAGKAVHPDVAIKIFDEKMARIKELEETVKVSALSYEMRR
jgi:hypothetical protein